MRRYLRDLHLGRIDPRTLGFRVARPGAAEPDFAELQQTAAAAVRLPQMAADLRPQLGQYTMLREALARYRVLAADNSLAPTKRGEAYGGAAVLHRLLVALGDLPTDTPPPTVHDPEPDDATLANGPRRFPARHGCG